MAIFRPLRDRQLRRQARLDAQYAARAQAGLINRQARAGEQNIAGITEALARAQGGYGPQIQDIYGRAQNTLRGLADTQRAGLGQTGGGTLQSELGQRLALSGNTSDLANTLGQATAGAATAGYGMGTAELGALAQRQAAAEEFGAKLPQLARLTGLQGVQQRAAQARQDQAKLLAQSAQETLQAIQNARNREFQKGAANLAYAGTVMKEQTRRAGLTIQQQRANEQARHNQAMESYDLSTEAGRQSARDEKARHNKWLEKHPKAGGKASGIDEQLSAQTGWIHNKDGSLYVQKSGPNKGKPQRYRPGRHVGGKGGKGGKSGL